MSKEAMMLALEALEPLVKRASPYGEVDWLTGCKAITALREALAEQPAPVQQCMDHGECFGGKCIYPAPQPAQVAEPCKQEPDELTDEQIDAACEAGNIYRIDFIRAYKAAHNIKENT